MHLELGERAPTGGPDHALRFVIFNQLHIPRYRNIHDCPRCSGVQQSQKCSIADLHTYRWTCLPDIRWIEGIFYGPSHLLTPIGQQ